MDKNKQPIDSKKNKQNKVPENNEKMAEVDTGVTIVNIAKTTRSAKPVKKQIPAPHRCS